MTVVCAEYYILSVRYNTILKTIIYTKTVQFHGIISTGFFLKINSIVLGDVS